MITKTFSVQYRSVENQVINRTTDALDIRSARWNIRVQEYGTKNEVKEFITVKERMK